MMMNFKPYSYIGIVLLTLGSTPSNAQWLPKGGVDYVRVSHEPVCNPKREQVRVRLNKSTDFYFTENLKEGDVLYAVRYSAQGLSVIGGQDPKASEEMSSFMSTVFKAD